MESFVTLQMEITTNLLPNKKAIDKINNLYSNGNIIIIFTARYMGRTKNNAEKAKNFGYEKTFNN